MPGNCPAVNVSERQGPGDPNDKFCVYEPKDYTDITPKIERFNAYARGQYNFTDTITGYTELSYFQVKTDTRGTPGGTRSQWYQASTNSIILSTNIFLPVGHPDNIYNAQNEGGAPVLLRWAGRPRRAATRRTRSATCWA